ncbi:MAG: hypothetical protein ACRENA_14545, partial [Vulcanimicrobiaceae bacterium]
VLTAADQALKPGGVCILLMDVIAGPPRDDAIDLLSLHSGRLTTLLENDVNWRLAGPLDLGLSARTLDTAAFDVADDLPAAIRVRGAEIHAPAMLVYEKLATTPPEAWKRYYGAYLGQPLAAAR